MNHYQQHGNFLSITPDHVQRLVNTDCSDAQASLMKQHLFVTTEDATMPDLPHGGGIKI